MADFESATTAKGFEPKDIQKMGVHEFINYIKEWLNKKKNEVW
jgi:hypothetical protein